LTIFIPTFLMHRADSFFVNYVNKSIPWENLSRTCITFSRLFNGGCRARKTTF